MKRPFDVITESVFNNLDKLKENQRYNFSNSEKFMLWIVGFSIGGISIIVTSLTQFTQSFDHTIIKSILILLSTSIVSGIVYRWFFYLYQIQYQQIEFYLHGAFSNEELMDIEAEDISKETDIKEVVRRLKSDFGEDASFVIDDYNKLTEQGKIILLEDFKKHYMKISESVKKEYLFTMDYVKKTFIQAFGISEKKYDKVYKRNSSKSLRIFGRIAAISFLVSCLSFITVIVILCISY